MAATMRLRPEARKLWFSKARSRISPWRWKNTARRSELLASPLAQVGIGQPSWSGLPRPEQLPLPGREHRHHHSRRTDDDADGGLVRGVRTRHDPGTNLSGLGSS